MMSDSDDSSSHGLHLELMKSRFNEKLNKYRKKSVGEQKSSSSSSKRKQRSPLLQKRPLAADNASSSGGSSVTPTSSTRLRNVATAEGSLNMTPSGTDAHYSQDESEAAESYLASLTMTTNGGSSSDACLEDLDLADANHAYDPQRTKQAIEHLNAKLHKTMELIKEEQTAKQENVNEYLRLSGNADKQQQQRIKTVFEKRNQKSTQSIANLQRKLETYQKRLKDVETFGVSGHRQPKEVLRDVGQGLKGVVDNIRGAKETIVSKPKEFAQYLIKNKFGSADNISGLKLEDGSNDDTDKHSHHGSGTLPARSVDFKYQSDDETSSVTSGSGPSGAHSSPRPTSGVQPTGSSGHSSGQHGASDVPTLDLEPLVKPLQEQLHGHREATKKLEELITNIKTQISADYSFLKQALEEEMARCERLEYQINDLTELHQHEVTNIKQELASMEEKMEYQLEERTRDMHELLETCQTRISHIRRITKMELQQQQAQLISMEGIENSNFRALLTKLINVVLALLAVVLVFVSTVANLLGPFLTSRVRILSTICLIAAIVATWQNWWFFRDFGQYFIQKYRHLFPVQ